MSRQIKIYGERNTNTNYLEQLIRLNLDVRQVRGVVPAYVKTIQKILPGKEWLRDAYFARTFDQNLGWKHSRVVSEQELAELDISQRGICFITITKNPYSWLMSLYRKPYSHHYASKPEFETFLQEPWHTVARDNCQEQLANPIELWNIKNGSYLHLEKLNGINLTTESTVQDPAAVIAKISQTFSIDRVSTSFQNYEKSTKDSGKNFAYYQDYYLNERWREKLSTKAIAIINQSLDKNLMQQFSYGFL